MHPRIGRERLTEVTYFSSQGLQFRGGSRGTEVMFMRSLSHYVRRVW
jgi:hypothetical protein